MIIHGCNTTALLSNVFLVYFYDAYELPEDVPFGGEECFSCFAASFAFIYGFFLDSDLNPTIKPVHDDFPISLSLGTKLQETHLKL